MRLSSAELFVLVLAATAWGWVDPAVRYQKAASILRRGGALPIIHGAHHVFPPGFDPFFQQIQKYDDSVGEHAESWPAPDEVPDLRSEIEGSGLFSDVSVKRYVWTWITPPRNTSTYSTRIPATSRRPMRSAK